MTGKIDLFINKMKDEELPQLVIDTFSIYYNILKQGNTGFIPEGEIDPINDDTLPSHSELQSYATAGENELKHTTIIKLNGGLGTSMGLNGPKCMLPIKNNLSFFDITALQIMELNKKIESKIPFILMNSFNTNEKSLELLKQYPDITTTIPSTFIQNKFPKVLRDTLEPAQWPENPSHEWNPPGHGDIYISLVLSGILDKLLDNEIYYAFISNIDNLGATLDTSLLGYFSANNYPFMMEVAKRTEMDKKGGHLARHKNSGRLLLRESAQAPEQDMPMFQDVNKYRFFNTNSIWINLKKLKEIFDTADTDFRLPLIVNQKHLVPKNKVTPKVYQLETAMGAAISLFQDSQAVVITKDRFRPVKKFDDILILWSDCFLLSDKNELLSNPERKLPPINVVLDSNFYGKQDQIKERFPFGVPSLINCESLSLKGDIAFGKDITITGAVTLTNTTDKQIVIPDGTNIEKSIVY